MIRRLTIKDVPAVMLLEKDSITHPWSEEDLAKLKEDDGKIGLVYEEDGQIAGYIGASYIMDEGEVGNLCVSPDKRRQGIGKSLMDSLIKEMDFKGVVRLFLEVSESNTKAISLYEKCGFECISVRKDYYNIGDNALIYRWCKHE